MAQACLDGLLSVIDSLHLKEGDRLPSERTLAERLEVSRNTVRETLIALAAKGRIEIRGRSGCYLRNASATSWESLRLEGAPDDIFAALRLVAPRLAMLAAPRCTPEQSRGLEDLTAQLGRSLVNRDGARTAQIFIAFFSSLAELSGNPYLVLFMRELGAGDRLATTLGDLDQAHIDAFFPLHVGLLQAVQSHDGERAGVLAAHCLDAFSALLGFSIQARSVSK